MDLAITLSMIAVTLGLVVYLIWLEKRPVELGSPRLIPLTPVLFLCILVLIMALAHLVSLLTGEPHMGRLGGF